MSKRIRRWWQKEFEGDGGIAEVLQVAFPIIISQSADSIMMFINRLFLSDLGKEYPSAAMTGGMTSFMFITPFFGLVGYTTALVAQYFGANQKKLCSVILNQALLISFSIYPFIIAIGQYAAPRYFSFLGQNPSEVSLSLLYFDVMIYGTIFNLTRMAFSGFFSGIGNTSIVMKANLGGLLINIPLSYITIHGLWGFPAMGIQGAAIGTVASIAFSNLILLSSYFSQENRRLYGVGNSFKISGEFLKKFLIYGAPNGLESMLNYFAFNTFVNLFHSYGPDEALAMTIAFNWDILAVLPVWGLNVGIMSLVGKNMGALKPHTAVRVTFSGLKISYFLMTLAGCCFFFFGPSLVHIFIPHERGGDFSRVTELGTVMLRLVSVYCLANATSLMFGAALRGAGDTRWCMMMSVFMHWNMLAAVYLCIRVVKTSPIFVWWVFIFMLFGLSLAYSWRFFQGKWKNLRIVDSGDENLELCGP